MIDRNLDDLDEEIAGEPDPDSIGQFDRCEYMYGVGLVACQLYLTAIMEKANKKDWLARGPKHIISGYSIAEIVYSGGNYVKHNPEELGNKESIAILKKLDLWREAGKDSGWVDYLASNLVATLLAPHPARFHTLLPWLIQWRNAVLGSDEDLT